MADDDPLSDNQAGDRLHAALLALGTAQGETKRADTALQAARRVLRVLQLGLLVASEKETDDISVIKDEPPSFSGG